MATLARGGRPEARVSHDIRQVMAFPTQRVWAGTAAPDAQTGAGENVLHRTARSGQRRRAGSPLAEFIAPLDDVQICRPVRPVGSGSSEFPIVVAIVAVGTKDSRSCTRAQGALAGRCAVQGQPVTAQAGLRPGAAAFMVNWMARGRSCPELRNHIQRIGCADCTKRVITVNGQSLLAGAGSVTTEAIFVLVHGGR